MLTIKSTVEQEEDRTLPLLNTLYSGEENMAAWMSLSTGSPCTQTGIATLRCDHTNTPKGCASSTASISCIAYLRQCFQESFS